MDRARSNPKIEFLTSTVVEKVNGETGVESVTLRSLRTEEVYDLPLGGLFVYIGNIPNTGMFGDGIQVDDNGFIQVDANMATDCPGVFVAGDVRKNPLKQVVTAAADGSIAALTADKYLDDLEAEMSAVRCGAECRTGRPSGKRRTSGDGRSATAQRTLASDLSRHRAACAG